MVKVPPAMKKSFEEAKSIIESVDDVKIYAYSDCDGICSAAIISTILDRLGKKNEVEFITHEIVNNIKIKNKLAIFLDIGSKENIESKSSMYSKIIVLDHHLPIRVAKYKSYISNDFLEINPSHYGINGLIHISGGGLSYLLAKEFGFNDLSWIGIVSAVGDMQNLIYGELKGLNKIILKDSQEQGSIKVVEDIHTLCKQTKPLHEMLSFFGDFKLPITDNPEKSVEFLNKINIPYKNKDSYRTLYDLNKEERVKIIKELTKMLSKELPPKYIKYATKIIKTDSYELLNEKDHTFMSDVNELAFSINLCSLNNESQTCFEVLKGDRGEYLKKMGEKREEVLEYLADKIEQIEKNNEIVQMKNFQYFFDETIPIGTIGMLTGRVIRLGDIKKPILGFTSASEKDFKVSLRCSRLLSFRGINFGKIMYKVAKRVGGRGGGHPLASGAYIPKEKKDEFLKILDQHLNTII